MVKKIKQSKQPTFILLLASFWISFYIVHPINASNAHSPFFSPHPHVRGMSNWVWFIISSSGEHEESKKNLSDGFIIANCQRGKINFNFLSLPKPLFAPSFCFFVIILCCCCFYSGRQAGGNWSIPSKTVLKRKNLHLVQLVARLFVTQIKVVRSSSILSSSLFAGPWHSIFLFSVLPAARISKSYLPTYASLHMKLEKVQEDHG